MQHSMGVQMLSYPHTPGGLAGSVQVVGIIPPPTQQPGPTQPPVQPPTPPSPAHTDGEGMEKLRQRVVRISFALGAILVCGSLAQFLFDIAVFKAAFHQLRGVEGIPHHVLHRIKRSFMSHGFSHVLRSICFGLLVPICGCVGAKKRSAARVGCFCCCNALTACAGLIGAISCLVVAFGTTVASPSIEQFMQTCDPQICLGSSNTSDIVGCLAGGAWQEHQPLSEEAQPLLHSCPTAAFLICGSELAEQKRRHDTDQHDYYRYKYQYQYYNDDSGSSGKGAFPESDEERFDDEGFDSIGGGVVRHLSDHGHGRGHGAGTPHRGGKKFSGGLRGFEDAGHAGRHSHHHHHHNEFMWDDEPMPANPIQDCEPRYKAIEQFHAAKEVLPGLLPEFIFYLIAKAVFAIPLIVLACCGFCSGKELWMHLRRGGLEHHGVYAQPQPRLQPSTNAASTRHFATGQTTQPLMMQQQAPLQPYTYHPPAQPHVQATQTSQAFSVNLARSPRNPHAAPPPAESQMIILDGEPDASAGNQMIVLG